MIKYDDKIHGDVNFMNGDQIKDVLMDHFQGTIFDKYVYAQETFDIIENNLEKVLYNLSYTSQPVYEYLYVCTKEIVLNMAK